MHHVAIMKKSWGFTEKILSGEKTVESRWYAARRAPWDAVNLLDVIYFKNSGEPIAVKAVVRKVLQYELCGPRDVKHILNDYGKEDGIGPKDASHFFSMFKNKKYCILIFLKDVTAVRPFNVRKRGFGSMAAWITVKNIVSITRKE